MNDQETLALNRAHSQLAYTLLERLKEVRNSVDESQALDLVSNELNRRIALLEGKSTDNDLIDHLIPFIGKFSYYPSQICGGNIMRLDSTLDELKDCRARMDPNLALSIFRREIDKKIGILEAGGSVAAAACGGGGALW